MKLLRCTLLPALASCLLLTSMTAHAQLKVPRSGGPSMTAPGPAKAPAPAPAATPAPATPAESAAAPAASPAEQKETAGRLAALGWLQMLDRRDWGTAWESASQVFRTQVPIAAWMDGIPKAREPLGLLADREPLEVAYKTELQGRPAGEYVTVVFESRFSNKPDAQEIVTLGLETDGRWRVLGYSTR